ncbi:unnamed protein product [Parnassius apollo]|uniref:(apollo) hypothetical protein n=1 Tax=Parnassius apollo TaxID=110799 RepID=A0A8S3W3W7_PARAO|nr:unnamed protein product [Parnassius apollo]
MSEKLGFEELRLKYKDVLSKAFTTNNIDLLDSFSRNTNEVDRKAAMDQAFRDKLLELLVENPDILENYVCFCIESCRRHMVTPTMPVVLLGDIFDALTLNKCEKMFAYVENGVNIWKEELFFVACKNNLLRMCNDLLRRLSRSQNTVFCGRILLFLAKFFPFSERSGLNIVSEFNLENITEFGGDNSSTLKDSLDEEMVVDGEKTKLSIDYNLYCRFWSLQDFFRNPNTCYNKIQWKTFVAHSGSVLSAFSSYKLEAVELQKSNLNRLKPVNSDVDMQGSNKEQHYFAKFLTNQKLLELQLSDSNFRRCVLIQFLILFQYLTSAVKFKMETQELKSDQTEWVKETTALVYRLLAETPPDGKRFAECVKSILRREEHWNSWKNDGCPEFKKPKPPVAVDSTEEVKKSRKRRKPVGDIIKEYEAQDKFYMGNNELTKLWNLCPDNLVACRTKERDFMPSLAWTNTKVALQILGVHEKATNLPPEDKSTVLDEDFWTMLKQCRQILEPITEAIIRLESNDNNLHKVVLTLKNMKSKLLFCLPEVIIVENDVKDKIPENVDQRIQMCLKPIHYAAYLLDPAEQGAELYQNQNLEAMGFISEVEQSIGLTVTPNLASYRPRSDFWSRRFLWVNVKEIKPTTWWSGLCASTALCKVAVRILIAPCTSAVERPFSTHSHIHNKKETG